MLFVNYIHLNSTQYVVITKKENNLKNMYINIYIYIYITESSFYN